MAQTQLPGSPFSSIQLEQPTQGALAPLPEVEIDNSIMVEDKIEPEKDKNLAMDPLTLSQFLDNYKTDHDNREYVDWAWYVYDNYVKGNHFVKYNDITKMVEAVPNAGSQKYAINKVWTTLRAVRGFVTKYDPKWHIFPEDNSLLSIKFAQYKQRLLNDRWLFGEMKSKSKQNVFQGLKYSIGILECVWNHEEQDVEYMVLDPYDVYFGGPSFPNCTRVTKAVWKTFEDIENDPKYKKQVGDLTTSPEMFASTWKQQLNDAVYGHQNSAINDKGTIVYETHYSVGKENGKKGKVNIATYTDSTFLRHTETDNKTLWEVFNIYRTDDNPGETYGEGWVKNLIPPQKMLDILEGVTMEYHHTFAKGRYVVAKNSGARIITNENGTIIEHNQGKRPIIENSPSMAASVDNQIQRINIYIEDIGGQHDACVDTETEILTMQGWKNYSDIKKGESILGFNGENLINDKIINIHTFDKKEETLLHIKNKNIDTLVTSNHRIPTYSDKKGDFSFKEASQLNTNDRLILSAGYKFSKKKTYSDDFVQLVGWIVTEGCFSLSKKQKEANKQNIRIIQSIKHKEECLLIENCLKSLGEYHKPIVTKDGCYQFYFANKLARDIRAICPNKELTFGFINKLTEQQVHLLIKTMLLADGNESGAKTVFYSTNKKEIDAFQYLCTLAGFNSVVRLFKRHKNSLSSIIRGKGIFKPLYQVSVKDQTTTTGFSSLKRKNKFVKEEKYTGIVWCPETTTTAWVARRNGYVFITGNSLGRIPTGASAGVAIEALQEGDANNLKDLVENYNIFLTDVAYNTMKMYARRLKNTKVIQTDDKDKDGKPDFFAIIGEKATNIPDTVTYKGVEIPVCVIREKEKIRVTVDSWLAFTRDAREQRVYKHYTAGLISRKAALDALQYGDADAIIEDAIREEVVAKMMQEQQQPEQPQPEGEQGPPPETETAGAISEGAGIPMPQ